MFYVGAPEHVRHGAAGRVNGHCHVCVPLWLHIHLLTITTPGLVHQECDKGEEEETSHSNDACQPLRQRTLGMVCYTEIRGQTSAIKTTQEFIPNNYRQGLTA